jgi:MOSC domain-containing protein YiiM
VRLGEVELEVVRVAAPCRILDDEIAPGAAAALRRRGGSVFRVLSGGRVRVGDPFLVLEDGQAGSEVTADSVGTVPLERR